MDGAITTIRELTAEELELVSGAWTWDGLASAMITGGIVGGISGAATGAGAPMGAVAGALLGGMGYLIKDIVDYCI